MKTEFLKSLGLSEDVIAQIQAESGKDVQAKRTRPKRQATIWQQWPRGSASTKTKSRILKSRTPHQFKALPAILENLRFSEIAGYPINACFFVKNILLLGNLSLLRCPETREPQSSAPSQKICSI